MNPVTVRLVRLPKQGMQDSDLNLVVMPGFYMTQQKRNLRISCKAFAPPTFTCLRAHNLHITQFEHTTGSKQAGKPAIAGVVAKKPMVKSSFVWVEFEGRGGP